MCGAVKQTTAKYSAVKWSRAFLQCCQLVKQKNDGQGFSRRLWECYSLVQALVRYTLTRHIQGMDESTTGTNVGGYVWVRDLFRKRRRWKHF